jgi:hypothetical protein
VSFVSFVVKPPAGTTRRTLDAAAATLLYTAITIGFTWPLARGLARDVPGDFGDPLLNSWIVSWGATHLGRGWWNANIFHPHPLSLGYSEHLLPQALQALPIYVLTRNPILGYNLLFLSTFVLSALGMFLFVREMTGHRDAAFVAGIAYAFAPYRVTSLPHLQVLSAQWMPFALYAFRRYFESHDQNTGNHGEHRARRDFFSPAYLAVLGGSVAWIAQNLSCGYYLFFFSPIVIAYLIWEITTRVLWRDRRVVLTIAATSAAVAVVTIMLTFPYIELRRLGFNPRSLDETARFSADVYAYLTADPNLRIWGSIFNLWPHSEGALFPGLTVTLLAALSVWSSLRALRSLRLPVFAIVGSAVVLIALLFGWSIRLPGLKVASFPRALAMATIACAVAVIASPRARAGIRQWLATPVGLFATVTLFAIVMSWGPSIYAKGRPVASTNLYALFYEFVPGFDGLRVPARFAMVTTFALAVLAGCGTTTMVRGASRRGISIAAAAFILVESFAVPIPLNQNSVQYAQPGLAPLPASVWPVPDVYRAVAALPANAAIIELPLGEPAFDVRYMFYSTTHWRRLVNGYSGGGPAEYEQLDQRLRDALTRPEPAWQALIAAQPTHAIVHEAFYAGDRGRLTSDWLQAHGARETANFGSDRIFQIPEGINLDTTR